MNYKELKREKYCREEGWLSELISMEHDDVPFDELHFYYHECDVFVAPTMSEGFGLTMAEAMACGLPVVTTDFGGQTDFVNSENGWIIKTKLVPVDDMLYEGVMWGMPDLKQLKKTMRDIYLNRDTLGLKREKALKDIKWWTWKSTAEKAFNALKQL